MVKEPGDPQFGEELEHKHSKTEKIEIAKKLATDYFQKEAGLSKLIRELIERDMEESERFSENPMVEKG
jgi:hypothetical protein